MLINIPEAREDRVSLAVGLGLAGAKINKPNRILGQIFRKAQKNWFWSIGLGPNPILLFFFSFLPTPIFLLCTLLNFDQLTWSTSLILSFFP
jgi:hypothetical protein